MATIIPKQTLPVTTTTTLNPTCLPRGVLHLILSFLWDQQDYVNFAKSCKFFNGLIQDPSTWISLFNISFRPNPNFQDWRQVYFEKKDELTSLLEFEDRLTYLNIIEKYTHYTIACDNVETIILEWHPQFSDKEELQSLKWLLNNSPQECYEYFNNDQNLENYIKDYIFKPKKLKKHKANICQRIEILSKFICKFQNALSTFKIPLKAGNTDYSSDLFRYALITNNYKIVLTLTNCIDDNLVANSLTHIDEMGYSGIDDLFQKRSNITKLEQSGTKGRKIGKLCFEKFEPHLDKLFRSTVQNTKFPKPLISLTFSYNIGLLQDFVKQFKPIVAEFVEYHQESTEFYVASAVWIYKKLLDEINIQNVYKIFLNCSNRKSKMANDDPSCGKVVAGIIMWPFCLVGGLITFALYLVVIAFILPWLILASPCIACACCMGFAEGCCEDFGPVLKKGFVIATYLFWVPYAFCCCPEKKSFDYLLDV